MKEYIFLVVFSFSKLLLLAQWTPISQIKTMSSVFNAAASAKDVPVYIARAKYDGGYIIGKLTGKSKAASFVYNGKIVLSKNFDVFVGSGKWVKASAYKVPKNAVQGSKDGNGNPIYMVRGIVADEYCVGMFRLNDDVAWFDFNGVVESLKEFEILTSATGTPVAPPPAMVTTAAILLNGKSIVAVTVTGAPPNSSIYVKLTDIPRIPAIGKYLQTDAQGKVSDNIATNEGNPDWCSLTAAERQTVGVVKIIDTSQQIIATGELSNYYFYMHNVSCN
jgi:Protein of unknown function (DUF3421)